MPIKKEKEKEECINLRRKGKSISEILQVVNASRGSVSAWVRDVPLTDIQKQQIKERKGKKIAESNKARPKSKTRPKHVRMKISKNATLAWSEKCRKARERNQEKGRMKLHTEDQEYAFGCALFWGEGSKSQHSVIFTNSDPDMVLFFTNFMRKYFSVNDEKLLIKLQYYLDNGNGLDEIENYWIRLLDVPRLNLRKGINKGKYYNKPKHVRHPYGICTIVVHDVVIVQQLYGSIKEMIGDHSDKWLF